MQFFKTGKNRGYFNNQEHYHWYSTLAKKYTYFLLSDYVVTCLYYIFSCFREKGVLRKECTYLFKHIWLSLDENSTIKKLRKKHSRFVENYDADSVCSANKKFQISIDEVASVYFSFFLAFSYV